VSGDRLWPARASALAGDLHFRSQRSEGDWPKPVVWPAKAGLLLWWPSSGPTLADLAGLSQPGSRFWPVRLVKIDFVEI
jgi:hypothetical protein